MLNEEELQQKKMLVHLNQHLK